MAKQRDAVPCKHKGDGGRPCGHKTTDPSGLCPDHRHLGAASTGQQSRTASSAKNASLAAAQAETEPAETTVPAEDVVTHNFQASERSDYLLEIVAACDLPQFEVEEGEIGGLVEPGCVVSIDSWVDEDSRVLNDSLILNGSLVADGSEVRGFSVMDESRLEGGSTLSGRSKMAATRAIGACEIGGQSTVDDSSLTNECRVVARSAVEMSRLSHHCLVEASTARDSTLEDGSQLTGGSLIDNSSMSNSEIRDGSVVAHGCSLVDRAKVLRGGRAEVDCALRQFATLSDGAAMYHGSHLEGGCHVSNGTILKNTDVQRRVKLSMGDEIKDSVISEADVAGWHTTRAKT